MKDETPKSPQERMSTECVWGGGVIGQGLVTQEATGRVRMPVKLVMVVPNHTLQNHSSDLGIQRRVCV